jgi:hypothetical protein
MRTIWGNLVLLMLFFIPLKYGFAQRTTNPDTVCIGSQTYYKLSNMPAGYTFTWGIKNGSGNIVYGQGTDSIRVQWSAKAGEDTIWVVENLASGCADTAKLVVKRLNLPSALISGSAQLCSNNMGSEVSIDLSGIPPFTVKYSINGQAQPEIKTSGKQIKLPPTPVTQNTRYELMQVIDRFGCNNQLTGNIEQIVLPVPRNLQIMHH